jgi:hypothetical protein
LAPRYFALRRNLRTGTPTRTPFALRRLWRSRSFVRQYVVRRADEHSVRDRGDEGLLNVVIRKSNHTAISFEELECLQVPTALPFQEVREAVASVFQLLGALLILSPRPLEIRLLGSQFDRHVTVARVAASHRLELYPKGLDALRALKLAQSAVAGLARITPDELQARVRERYPEAAELPLRPALDELLPEAGLAFTWQDSEGAYVAPAPPTIESSVSLHRQETIVSPSAFVLPIEVPREVEEAQQFERRLKAAYRASSYLVLATEPKISHLNAALDNIGRHFPMTVFHCEREMLAALHAEAEQMRVRWEVILRADATPPESRDAQNLRKLAAQAAKVVADRLRQRQERTLVMFPGLLARYGQLTILDEIQDGLGANSLWVLVGSEGRGNPPSSEKQTIPARPSQWAWIPEKWLDNDFRKYRIESERSRA